MATDKQGKATCFFPYDRRERLTNYRLDPAAVPASVPASVPAAVPAAVPPAYGVPMQEFNPGVPVPATQPHPRYLTATPLTSVGANSTPVDCPVCGAREMTRVEHHVGNSNQYVPVNGAELNRMIRLSRDR